jgi:protein tyrosine phosphatase (PTP) superfamily phosphohydrolase (DUF442 family)
MRTGVPSSIATVIVHRPSPETEMRQKKIGEGNGTSEGRTNGQSEIRLCTLRTQSQHDAQEGIQAHGGYGVPELTARVLSAPTQENATECVWCCLFWLAHNGLSSPHRPRCDHRTNIVIKCALRVARSIASCSGLEIYALRIARRYHCCVETATTARIFLITLALSAVAIGGICATAPQAPDVPAPPAHSPARKAAIEGLPNFGEVTPTLYRGAQPTAQGLRKLKEMNFDIVVDFRAQHDPEGRIVTALGMEYTAIPWQCYNPEDEDVAQFLSLVRAHPGKKIFVHCRDGADRTGMEIAAYRIAEQGWSSAEARKEMEAFGFSSFHRTICKPLVSYEANFPSRFRTSPAFKILRGPASSYQ